MTTTPTSLATLIAAYKTGHSLMSSRERAIAEKNIYDAVPLVERTQGNSSRAREHTLFELLGRGAPAEYRIRFELLNSFDWAAPLWPRIDNKAEPMTLYTAMRLLREAKQLSRKEDLPQPEAMRQILEQYDALNLTFRADGSAIRRKNPSALPSIADAAKGKGRRKAKDADLSNPHIFWPQLRAMVAQHIALRLKDADPLVAEQVWRGFERDLKILTDETTSKLSRIQKSEEKAANVAKHIGHGAMRAACNALAMDAPKPSQKLDMKLARSQKNKLARLYHPDSHQGDESMRPQYEAVLQAYQTLEAYDQQFEGEKNGDGHGK